MKKNYLAALIIALPLLSCSPQGEMEPDDFNLQIDESRCVIKLAENYTNALRISVYNTSDSIFLEGNSIVDTFAVKTIKDMLITFHPQLASTSCKGYPFFTIPDENNKMKEWESWLMYKEQKVVEAFELSEGDLGAQQYVYAGVKAGAEIVADKVLFGRAPGEDLGDMFFLLYKQDGMNRFIASYPDFEVVGDILKVDAPITFKEAFSKGMAIPKSYTYLSLSEQPTEKYEEITFTIHIPFETEYWEEYDEVSYTHDGVLPNENRHFTGTMTVKFSEK